MHIIDHRRFLAVRSKKRLPVWVHRVLTGLVGVVAVIAVTNVAMAIVYRNKVLPNYSVGAAQVGNIPFDQLDRRVSPKTVLPSSIELTKDDKKLKVSPVEVGIIVDWPSTREEIRKTRLWIPLLSLVTKHQVSPRLELANTPAVEARLASLQAQFKKDPVLEHIEFKADNFTIIPAQNGYTLDPQTFRSDVMRVIGQGGAKLTVPVSVAKAGSSLDLKPHLSALQAKLASKITLTYGGKSQQLTAAQIGRLYTPSGQTMELSAANISAVIGEVAAALGVTPVNQSEAVQAALYAVNKAQAVTFVLAAQGARVYRYCTAVKGVSAALLPEYRQKLAAAYGDPRGWSQGGAVMVYAESGCNYTAWLSAPGYMTSFGAICDSYYSCRVGANVVVNVDRWNGATDPWNAAGGSLEDYRSMVINHETGHWLGFGHRNCPGPGQPAPVMQQQSISLQGCSFNPWPTAAEIASL